MKEDIKLEEISLSEMDIVTETEVKGAGNDTEESFEIWTITGTLTINF